MFFLINLKIENDFGFNSVIWCLLFRSNMNNSLDFNEAFEYLELKLQFNHTRSIQIRTLTESFRMLSCS